LFEHEIDGEYWSNHTDTTTSHGHKIHYFDEETKRSACGHTMLSDRKVRNGLFIKDTKSYPLRRFCQSCIKKLYKMNPCIEVLKGLMIYADKERKSNYNKV